MKKLRLKHLDIISKDSISYKDLAKDLLNYNRWKFWKIFSFIREMEELNKHIAEVRSLDILKVEESPDCEVNRPDTIDEITLIAMLELQGLFDRDVDNIEVGELIAQTISITCYSANISGDFDLQSEEFLNFKQKVYDLDLVHAMGLYHWISATFNESYDGWNKAFFEVEIQNPEYDQAGGQMLNKFNVLGTIKTTCADFNTDYKGALQMTYGITQANSLMRATNAFVESRMSDIAEARMRSQQQNH